MSTIAPSAAMRARTNYFYLGFSLLSGIALVLINLQNGVIQSLLHTWLNQEEYSHGILVPFISAYMIAARTGDLKNVELKGSWIGVLIVISGAILCLFGRLSAIHTLGHYAFVISIWGLCLAAVGFRAFRIIWPGLFVLIFMVKLPPFIYNNLSSQLQLVSSELGVWFIRLFNISVYLEGNVIDLGAMKLQVVEACNGLRYLFPLMTLSMIMAIMYRASFWKKALVFLTSMPISVLMNSFRIGAIGVTVEYWGKQMAEGILHDFEGWFVFLLSFMLIALEIQLLEKFSGNRRSFSEVFQFHPPKPDNTETVTSHHIGNKPALVVALLVMSLSLFSNFSLQSVPTVYPERLSFDSFPLRFDRWTGQQSFMEPEYLKALSLDDYFIADYNADKTSLNLYMAYYKAQMEGEGNIHSPRSCLPGSGWRIVQSDPLSFPLDKASSQNLTVNRAVISKGEQKAVVFYWLQGRGHTQTNELQDKASLVWDRLSRGRSDGALIRLIKPVDEYESTAQAETMLIQFVQRIASTLPTYIPD